MYTFLMVLVLGFQELDSMTSYAYSSDEEIQCNSGTCNEKRRRVHNEVERRRKDKINNWIIRIGDLLPDKNRKKQCINEILEQAVVYIRYLQDANDKLLQDKCTEVQVEELRRMAKKMKELEEENTQCLRLLQKAGISSITCPDEFCDHKTGRYSNKLTPEQASALLTQLENDSLANGVTKLKSVMQNKCGIVEDKSINYNMKYDFNGKKCNELTENISGKLATCETESIVPSEKIVSSVSTPQSLPSNHAENQTTTVAQHCPSPSISTNSSKCQYAISCSSEETNMSLDVCDITAVTQALPPVPVMSTSQNSSVHQNSVHKTANQSVTPLNQLVQPQILSPCAPAPATNRGSTVQNISSPLLVINEHGIPVLHNIVAFQNIQPSVFSNCSSAPAILTSSSNEFGQTQSPLAISQIAPYGNYKPIYVTKDINNSAKVASVSTTFGVAGSPNSSVAGVPILSSNSGFTSTIRPQNTLTGETKNILSPLIAQVPIPGSSQGSALKLPAGLQPSLGQGTLSQIISHPMDDLTASNMHLQPCNNHSISQNLPSNTLPPTMVTPGGILVGHPLSIGQHGQVLTMGNGQILAAQSSVSAQQPFPTALILPNGQVIPVVSQPSVVYANPTVNNNIVLAQTGKQNLQAASPSMVTSIKNQSSPLLANSINNTILFSPSGTTGNNFKLSSVALTLSQASNSQTSASFTSDMTSTITQKSNTMESLRTTSQNDHVIASTEEDLLKCSGTTQAFQGPSPAVTCSKNNCNSSEANSRRASASSTKSASITKSNKSNPTGSKRPSRVLKPKPSSTSPRHSGVLSGKMQQSGRDIGMNIRKHTSCSSSTSSSDTNIEKMANSANANSCTNSLSSSSPISRTDDHVNLDSTETSLVSSSSNTSTRMTTDILAKATESIFSSCVSDLSPSITSFSSAKNDALRSSNECALLDSEKNKHDNEQKHDKQRLYHIDSSNSSVTDSCVSTQPQDLLSTLTATVFGDSSADSSGDELAFTHVESSPSKLMSTLSRSLMTKNLKSNSHVEIDIAKLKCRTTNNNNEVPPIKKVKTVESSGNGTASSTEQCREKVQASSFVNNGLAASTNSEDSHNRITSTTKCFLSEEKQFKQKIVCTTTNPLSTEITQMPTSVSQLLLADSTSALCSKSSQNPERQNSTNVNFVSNGESSVPDTELPALILGSLGDDSNTPSVNGSSNSGIPFLALSPSEHFPSDLPKDTPHNHDGSFNMLDNCRSSNIGSVGGVKNKRSPSIQQKSDINKTNSDSNFAEINSKSSDQSKQVLSSSRLPEQETDISSTLSPPLVMKPNCNQAVGSQQGIVHEDNLNAIQKETQCPPTPNIMGNTSQAQSDVNCQASILSPVTSLSFIAPSPPPLLSRNMINENHTSISSHFPPLSSQSNLGISSSQTQLPSTVSSQSSNSTHIPSFKQSTERSATPKKSVSFPTNNPPSIITTTTITSTTSTSTNFASHTTVSHTLSSYSAEALIGQQPTMTSTSLINPIVSQSYYSVTSNSDCPRTNRPPISYSAESLIQTQSCIDKKQDMMVNKEAIPSNVSPNMNSYRHQTQHFQQRGGQQGVLPQAANVSQSLVTNVTDRRLSCSNLIPSSDMMPQNSLQSNFHLQGTPSYANLTHTISTGPQQNLMNNHFGGGPPILMRHGAPACQQLDQCLPCSQPSHSSSSLPQGYSLALGGNKNCHSVNTFHQNRPPVDASISQTLPSCLSNSGNLSNIPITNSQQQNGCLFPNHAPSGSLLQVPDTNFSILQNSSSSFNNQVRNENRPPVFNNFPQHTQNPLVNNLFHGPFVTNVNTQRNEISNVMPSHQSNRPNEGVKHVTREQRSSSQSQSPPNQTKISPKSKSNAKKSKPNAGTEDVTMPSTPYDNINVRMPTHFSVPDLSFPRNETPCLGNTYFGGSQRPLVPTISNIQTQNKSIPTVAATDPNITANPTYNPLFRRQSDNSLNFNFQPSSFSVNSLHRPATTGSENNSSAQITCHTTTASAHPLPNFNLSNIFPDISTSNESINLPGMKFHHNNHIISPTTSNQIQATESSMTHPASHQNRAPPPLYHGRTHPPVIHNGVGFNGILGPNAHGFEGHGTQVAMGINNTMGHPPPPPPPFAPSHSHTPSFGNVLPPLNFPMHDH